MSEETPDTSEHLTPLSPWAKITHVLRDFIRAGKDGGALEDEVDKIATLTKKKVKSIRAEIAKIQREKPPAPETPPPVQDPHAFAALSDENAPSKPYPAWEHADKPISIKFYEAFCELCKIYVPTAGKFAKWLGIAGLGAMMGINVTCAGDSSDDDDDELGVLSDPVFLNFYLMLIGRSRLSQKSRLIRRLRWLLSVREIRNPNSTKYLISEMADRMRRDGIAIMTYNEGSELFNNSGHGNGPLANMDQKLCDAYDVLTDVTSGALSNDLAVHEPFLSVIIGSTPQACQDCSNDGMLENGLFNRLLVAYERNPEDPKLFVKFNRKEVKKLEDQLNYFLYSIRHLKIEFRLTRDFKERMETWRSGKFGSLRDQKDIVAGHEIYFIKTACILEFSDWAARPENYNTVYAHSLVRDTQEERDAMAARKDIKISVGLNRFDEVVTLINEAIDDNVYLRTGIGGDLDLNKVIRAGQKHKEDCAVDWSTFLNSLDLDGQKVKQYLHTMFEGEKCCVMSCDGAWQVCFKCLNKIGDYKICEGSEFPLEFLKFHSRARRTPVVTIDESDQPPATVQGSDEPPDPQEDEESPSESQQAPEPE